jgi:hypothetical protein
MSATPPNDPQKTNAGTNRAGDGARLGVTEVRGAERTGRNIWILVISVTLAIVVVLGYWLFHAPHMAKLNHPQARDMNAIDAASYNMQDTGARGSPGDQPAANTQ